jgi:hypothetical protein
MVARCRAVSFTPLELFHFNRQRHPPAFQAGIAGNIFV